MAQTQLIVTGLALRLRGGYGQAAAGDIDYTAA